MKTILIVIGLCIVALWVFGIPGTNGSKWPDWIKKLKL